MNRIRRWTSKIVRFAKAEDGPTTVEYAVMLMVIVLGCVLAIRQIGGSSNDAFGEIGTTLSNSADTDSSNSGTP